MRQESYIGRSRDQRVFLKLPVSPHSAAVLERPSAISVNPKVLAGGTYGQEPYIVQEFVDGVHPDRGWLISNQVAAAAVIRRYHDNQPLKDLLRAMQPRTYTRHI